MNRIVLFGGASEIGLAVVERFLRESAAEVLLVGRPVSSRREQALKKVRAAGASSADWLDWEASDLDAIGPVVDRVFTARVDLVVLAAGVLGDPLAWRDLAASRESVLVNAAAPICLGAALAERLIAQASGQLVLLSSVAAERVRGANLVYGATKAAADGFFRQLGYKLRPHGVATLVVRPGAVLGRMTAGRQVAFMVTPQRVAEATWRGVQRGRSLIRVPWIFGPITAVFTHLPESWAAKF